MAYPLHELESLIAKRVDLRRTYSLPVTPWHPIESPDAAPQGNAFGGFLSKPCFAPKEVQARLPGSQDHTTQGTMRWMERETEDGRFVKKETCNEKPESRIS